MRPLTAVLAALTLSAEAASPAAPPPVVAIVRHQEASDRLVRVHPATLRPAAGRQIVVANISAWAFSADRRRLALAESRRGNGACGRASLRLVDPQAMRVIYARAVGPGEVSSILWVGSRLLTLHERCDSSTEFVVRDVASARVVRRQTVDGSVVRAGATDNRLALLVAPDDRIGTARLLVLEASGSVRSTTLGAIAAGEEWTGEGVKRAVRPALAVAARRAFVVPAAGPIAEIDLDSLASSYRALMRRTIAARAKASEGSTRHALYVRGLLAVSGRDEEAPTIDGTLHVRERPAGLELIDTRSWQARSVDGDATWITYGSGLLFATRHTWDSIERRTIGAGVAAYDLAGEKRYHLFPRIPSSVDSVYGGRVYVRRGGAPSLWVVRARDGHILGRRTSPLPHVLFGRASSYWRNGI